MEGFFVQRIMAIALTALGLLNFIWIWGLHRQWWALRWVRRAVWAFPLAGLGVVGIWMLFTTQRWFGPSRIISIVAIIFFLITVALAISLPLSGVILSITRLVRWILGRRGEKSEQFGVDSRMPATEKHEGPESEGRRDFITAAATVVPLIAVGASMTGLVGSMGPVQMPNVDLFFKDLPPDLEGLRILHLSDTHLGYYIDLHDLEKTMVAAEGQRADMVLVTGDISDYLPDLPEALRLIDGLKPRHGTFASLGNHEYYRGIEEVLRTFERGPIPLLTNSGALVRVGDAQLYIGGADDPANFSNQLPKPEFLKASIDQAFNDAPHKAFKLLMSHRPEGFDSAAEREIELTLSGHTHACGQMGWNGRSLFEQLFGLRYQWGHYRKPNGSQLYTTAGAGHWFPFRLGVPREAPVYTLRTGNQA
jgi:predicted MPP superfamily phosphohydrolase